jgi:hypothetical protein
MELDAGAERDGVGHAVGGNLRHVGGEQRRDAPILVEGVERLVDVLGDDADKVGGGGHRVERRRFTDRGNVNNTALGLSPRCSRCRQQRRDERHGNFHRMSHAGSSLVTLLCNLWFSYGSLSHRHFVSSSGCRLLF